MLTINNQSGKRPPRGPFSVISDEVLGKDYDLSLVFADDVLARRLNWQYRKRRYIPNVLSFPLEKNSGEIFINLNKADKEKELFEENLTNHVNHLFIHGVLHLKGMTHSSKMESKERQLLQSYIPQQKISSKHNGKISNNRNRHRDHLHQGGRLPA